MDNKKLLMLLILFVAVVGLAMSSATAAKKTTAKLYFKKDVFVEKQVGPKHEDRIFLTYCDKNHNHKSTYCLTGYQTTITMNCIGPSKYHLVSAKIAFIKKTGAKKPFTKSLKSDEWDFIGYNAPKGYKPYYAHVTYKY